MTDFERGLEAAFIDLLAGNTPDDIVEIAEQSADTREGLHSKFAQGYRRFAFHHMERVLA